MHSPLCTEKTGKIALSEKTQEIWKFCQNTWITQICCQGANSLILNIQDIAMFAAEFQNFSYQSHIKLSQIA